MDDLGPRFAGDLTGAEVRYLVEQEWAQTADDVLWRRSKLGLTATAQEERARSAAFMAALPQRGRRCRVNESLPKRAQLQAPISADCHISVV